MRAAVVEAYGTVPVIREFEEPSSRGPAARILRTRAASLNPVDVRIASGNFYAGSPPVPYVAGQEGVGETDSGELYYFGAAVPPYGSLGEWTVVDEEELFPVPKGLDPALAAALGIAGITAWLALGWRAQLRPQETVVVLGATGAVGSVAVQAARILGAGKIVAVGRDQERLEAALKLGADDAVSLSDPRGFREALSQALGDGADVVVDPLWGPPAEVALEMLRPNGRLVQLGQSAGPTATVSSAAVRGKMLSILGQTGFALPIDLQRSAYQELCRHALEGRIRLDIRRLSLEELPRFWNGLLEGPGAKLVVTF
jgi:NADPH2:quinone reductase